MNASENPPSTLSQGYSPEVVRSFLDKIQELRNAQAAAQLNLDDLSRQLTVQRAKTFAQQAMGRRLPVIERAVLNIFRIYPPDRRELLSKEECTDIAIQIHAFAINVYAVFDNAAWVCMLEAGGSLPPPKVGIYRKECQVFLPPSLLEYVSSQTCKQWFNEYGKVYRDATAHRIPPYLPDRNFTPADGTRFQELEAESLTALRSLGPHNMQTQAEKWLARHEQLEAEKKKLGHNSLIFLLTLTGEDTQPPIYLHPQLLCDWGLIHEFVQAFTEGMRQLYGWKAPDIPPIIVR